MSMELDDLLKKEGLDAAGLEDALAWARRRAAELVRDVDGDPELGPLLEGARIVGTSEESPRAHAGDSAPTSARASTSAPGEEKPKPLFNDLRGLQAAFLAEAEDEDDELPEVGAVLRAFQKGKGGRGQSGPGRSAKPSLEDEAGAGFGLDEARAEAKREAETPAPAPPPAVIVDPAPTPVEPADAKPDEATSVASPEAAATSDERADEERDAGSTIPVPAEAPAAAPGDDDAAATAAAATTAEAPEHGLPAPPEADLDPLAGIDFDDLPGVDEDDEEEDHTHVDLPVPGRVAAVADSETRTTMIPTDGADMTLPSMQAPLAELGLGRPRLDGGLPSGELTERTLNPLLPAEPTGEVTVTAMAPNPLRTASDTVADVPAAAEAEAPAAEEPAEEIELLDDEDLLLVEEEPEEEPEWKQALKSVEGEGGGSGEG